ncbi:pseudouridine synthase [Thermoplasmatales archaeon ex4572_165]|nr:MAG: pseudouridine synthase [Thermoplasmatales archaeon ex4572_165]RLF60165.1 MAG: pseudouridine synthase [Thermoplasmata archaeon]
MNEKVRLQKYLAQCGLGSRRTCESYIEKGRIKVDDVTIKEQGTQIDPNIQTIKFDEMIVTPKQKIWIFLNKPPEYICSSKDPKKRKTFLDLLPKEIERVFCIGRLDYMSEGLLIITNDGDAANKIIHPRYEIKKIYEVTTYEPLTKKQMEHMEQGIKLKEEILKVMKIKKNNMKNQHYCYEIILTEGKTRHIRRMLAELNIHIVSLKRTQIGPILLGSINPGEWRYATKKELQKIEKHVKSS